jgi:DNA modification methylase
MQAAAPPPASRNDLLPKLTLVKRDTAKLKLPSRQLRKVNPVHVKETAQAISSLGFCDPVLIDEDDKVIDGVVRIAAAKAIGLTHISCLRAAHLTPAERRLLRLALNRLGEKGSWDLDELKVEIEELILEDAPVEITGFEPAELDQILLDDEVALVEEGPLEPSSGAAAVSRLGDLFRLGEHRLLCADAADPAAIARLMGQGEKCLARLILTDPPYNVPIAGNVTKGRHREFVQASGEMTPDEYERFCASFIKASLPHLVNGGLLAAFIDWRGYPTIHAAATKAGLAPFNLVVWAKTNAGMGSLYRSQHELLPLFKKGNAAHLNNVALGRKGRWRSNLWTYPGASSLGSDARKGLRDHPTVKPTAMLKDALLDLTNRGDVVLDPFLGSGSTLIAAEAAGRICRGTELDPLYGDVVIRRFEEVTGQSAILEETDETFDELADRRRNEAQAT